MLRRCRFRGVPFDRDQFVQSEDDCRRPEGKNPITRSATMFYRSGGLQYTQESNGGHPVSVDKTHTFTGEIASACSGPPVRTITVTVAQWRTI